jgi:hypothetical protein
MASFDETLSDDDVSTQVLCTVIVSASLTAECHPNMDGIASVKLTKGEGRETKQLTLLRTDWQRLLFIAIPANHVVESRTAGIVKMMPRPNETGGTLTIECDIDFISIGITMASDRYHTKLKITTEDWHMLQSKCQVINALLDDVTPLKNQIRAGNLN